MVNLFLYDVKEKVQLRCHDWERLAANGGGDQREVQQKRPPLRLDCF